MDGPNDSERARDGFSNTKIDFKGPDSESPLRRLQESISSFPPVVFVMTRHVGSNFAIGMCIAMAFWLVMGREFGAKRSRYGRPGSVADLVRRGQLRSDRRGISKPLKCDDPFNNPLVRVGKGSSTVEMCGKVYRLAPVTLTEEQQAVHQKRRSRAYQWKRPKLFLKEGDSIPPGVDPDTVRWIPANHPFATTTSEIDEDLAQNNVYQKHGVPFRIQAEHEALQKRVEALQNNEKPSKALIDSTNDNDQDLEMPSKWHSHLKLSEEEEQGFPNGQMGNSDHPILDAAANSIGNDSSAKEIQKP